MITIYLEKIFNISRHEATRVFYAWLIRFFYKFGLSIGATLLIVNYVGALGIERLPYLYLLQAMLIILGTSVFSFILHFVDIRIQIYFSLACCILLIIFSELLKQNTFFHLGLLMLAISAFLSQIGIFISNFIEDFFSPWESHRTAPVIESADTVGGIASALGLSLMLSLSLSDKAYFLWVGSCLMAGLSIFLLNGLRNKLHEKNARKAFNLRLVPQKTVISYIRAIKSTPFLQTLLLVVFIQWTIGHLVEFQYTKVVDEAVLSGHQTTSHEIELMKGLSQLQIMFYSFALVVQLIISSRILKFLGTFGGFVVHALLTLFGAISLLLNFSFFTAVLAKNNFEISGIIHKNAYEASYYAFKHGSQRSLREFYEGFINPAGIIAGTLFLLVVQLFFVGIHFLSAINLVLLFLAFLMVVFSFQMQDHYTNFAYERLNKMDDPEAQEHAIEILAQKGHKNGIDFLLNSLHDPRFSKPIKLKILEELGRSGHPRVIADILPYIHSPDKQMQNASLNSLAGFKNSSRHVMRNIFQKYRILEELKKLLNSNISDNLKKSVIRILFCVNHAEAEALVLDVMNTSSVKIKLECFNMLEGDLNKELAQYLSKYLNSKSYALQARAAFLLWKFKEFRKPAEDKLKELTAKPGTSIKYSLSLNFRNIKSRWFMDWLHKQARAGTGSSKDAAICALALSGDKEAFNHASRLMLAKEARNRYIHLFTSSLTDQQLNYMASKIVLASLERDLGVKLSDHKLNFNHLHYLSSQRLNSLRETFKILGQQKFEKSIAFIINERKNLNLRKIEL